jgi:hypothetical protein
LSNSFINLVNFMMRHSWGYCEWNSFTLNLLLVYGTATDFCMLILCPDTLLKVFITCKSILGDILIIESYLQMGITWFLLFLYASFLLFILCYCSKISRIILNKSSESGNTCVIANLGVNAFTFSPVSIMLAIGLLYIAFIMSN